MKNKAIRSSGNHFPSENTTLAYEGRQFNLFSRDDHASIEETLLVFHLFNSHQDRVMLDVGAHGGGSSARFAKYDWQILCFEPDPENRKKLAERLGCYENVKVDSRAVGEHIERGKNFYSSEESTGISSLLAFHESHIRAATVDVTTIDEIVKEAALTHVDFLKIDVEGYDFSVLKGVPWAEIKPDVILCEFEDAKTVKLDHRWTDIAEFLVGHGYTVYVSEWHPIVRYGIRHEWRGMNRYPCALIDVNAWGNLLAFKTDPGEAAIGEMLNKALKVGHQKSGVTDPGEAAIGETLNKALKVKLRKSGATDPSLTHYVRFAEWLKARSLPLFRMGQFTMRVLRFLKRHLGKGQ